MEKSRAIPRGVWMLGLVSLFMEGNGYPENNNLAIRKASLTIKNNSTWVIFTGVPSGKYAIAILHDENDDLHMNKTALGLPKEGYGFSNNVMGAFGPPSYKRANFIYKANTLIEINIKTRY